MSRSEALMKRPIADSRLLPGTYSSTNPPAYESLKYVQDVLLEHLSEELMGFDVLDLCYRLYCMHESMVFNRAVLSGKSAITVQALRSMTELAIKTCGHTGIEIGEDHFNYLLALAFRAIAWDSIWDQFNVQLFPQVIVVSEDFTLTPVLHDKAIRARDAYTQYLINRHRVREIELDELPVPPNPDALSDWLDFAVDNSDLGELHQCLIAEIGYGLTDYLKFVRALVEALIVSGGLVAVLDARHFLDNCFDQYGLESSTTETLLRDFTLAEDTVDGVSARDIFSIGRRKRDTRFVRRPILDLSYEGNPMLLCGFESVLKAGEIFLKEVQSGRIPVRRWADNASVTSAFGALQGKRGEPFKQNLARDCMKIVGADNVCTEKRAISGVRRNHELGAVDIFIVDREKRRFILAEVKNSASTGLDPLEMKDEYKKFVGEFLPVLRRKGNWFRSNIEDLKSEWGIPLDQHFTIEEVVVVNQQRPWVLSSPSCMPVMDDDVFLARLGRGDVMCTYPVADCDRACLACSTSQELAQPLRRG